MQKHFFLTGVTLAATLLGGGCLRRAAPVSPPLVTPQEDIRAVESDTGEEELFIEADYAALEDQAMTDEEAANDLNDADLKALEDSFANESDADLQNVP